MNNLQKKQIQALRILEELRDVLIIERYESFDQYWKPKVQAIESFIKEAPQGMEHVVSALQDGLRTVEILKNQIGNLVSDNDDCRPCERCREPVPLQEYCGFKGLYLCPDCFGHMRDQSNHKIWGSE